MARILLADDDDELRATIREMLERWGHEVVEATNGNQVLEILDSNAFDLLLIDIIMPEKEGMETLLLLRKKNKSLKVIAISGGGRIGPEEYLHQARLLGAKATLQKPFTGDALKSALHALGI